ncbi:MAG TPA: hypothetical protein PLH23_04935 [Hyphomonadaceae bacterium]|nr:hypothetical protein [Hyphomonadaceae bacterium]HPI47591.1 hypothetical protein [Hyphomonadaceae bacterium]
MRASEVRRTVTFFRTAVGAVLYDRAPGKDAALLDLHGQLERFRAQGDWQVTGTDVPTSAILLVVSTMRLWANAPSDKHREALTGWAVGAVDTLAKWLDGELIPATDHQAELSRSIGGR